MESTEKAFYGFMASAPGSGPTKSTERTKSRHDYRCTVSLQASLTALECRWSHGACRIDSPPDEGVLPEVQESIAEVGVGDVLDGKYLMERVLGSGGMGVVFAARHLQLDERVAVKL